MICPSGVKSLTILRLIKYPRQPDKMYGKREDVILEQGGLDLQELGCNLHKDATLPPASPVKPIVCRPNAFAVLIAWIILSEFPDVLIPRRMSPGFPKATTC